MKNNAAKKAKGGILSIVFSRTALVLLLILLQICVLLYVTTTLNEHAVYYYGAMAVMQAVVIIYIVNEKGNPEFMCTWIILILVAPVFGCLFYIYAKLELGTKYIQERLESLDSETKVFLKQKKEIIDDIRFRKPANANLSCYLNRMHFPAYRNTKIDYYESGEVYFPVMLKELEKAEKYIFMEYFIIDDGYMWQSILDILKRKAAAGVEVRLMYDGMNSISRLPHDYPKVLQKYGIKCKLFSPILPVLSTTHNNRDHRKICVIDGKTGFTGGLNLADEYINEIERFGYWKDTAIRMKGDAVQSLTMLFLQMWNVSEQKKEEYEKYLTKMSSDLRDDLGFCIPYGDSPFDREDVGKEVYFHILNHAKKYVYIMTPYLILDREMVAALTRAAKSGIDVRLVLPFIPDKWSAFSVAKTYYKELISSGVKIYEYLPGFVHAKVFLSDSDTATVGTINMDYRSLFLHFENAVFIYNNPVIYEIEQDFDKTFKKCARITVADLKKINPFLLLTGKVLRLIAPLM
ncbi:MAG: cardiolipin synthase [Schaedlerella sp.]|nr:cardiolipin synthase [Schaedlerella sp.]